MISSYNNFLRESGLITYEWPRIGDVLKAEDDNKERKLRLYAEYLFATTDLDFRNNSIIPNCRGVILFTLYPLKFRKDDEKS